ncbi:hypothetical protein D3C86_2204720 [compost metagenome]
MTAASATPPISASCPNCPITPVATRLTSGVEKWAIIIGIAMRSTSRWVTSKEGALSAVVAVAT